MLWILHDARNTNTCHVTTGDLFGVYIKKSWVSNIKITVDYYHPSWTLILRKWNYLFLTCIRLFFLNKIWHIYCETGWRIMSVFLNSFIEISLTYENYIYFRWITWCFVLHKHCEMINTIRLVNISMIST